MGRLKKGGGGVCSGKKKSVGVKFKTIDDQIIVEKGEEWKKVVWEKGKWESWV